MFESEVSMHKLFRAFLCIDRHSLHKDILERARRFFVFPLNCNLKGIHKEY